MAESRSVTLVPLNGSNYSTWKVQCRMALMKDGLWSIVNGIETAPSREQADKYTNFMSRRDRAPATIVLSVEPQKKTWANKLELRRKLYLLRSRDGESVQKHINFMMELSEGLSGMGDPVEEDDQVVHLLANLPESFNMLVKVLEANTDVPSTEAVTERLLHEERKIKDRNDFVQSMENAMINQFKRSIECYHCEKMGHIN